MLVYYYEVLNSKLALTYGSLYSYFQSIKFKKNEYGSSSEELTTICSCDVEEVRRSRNLKPNLDQNKLHLSGSSDDRNEEDLLSRRTLLQMADAHILILLLEYAPNSFNFN
ncbi:unnamed protein product [Macrosiphum euphorbiae]|uniref:Uncharacterized protein n=1 Tax=Macrosiphum euphorbiae TaxID=13131 RepID=A0AAV0VIW1_9HEMI|nr:unnamed protein product [Macrosiphum euphorbiae]